MWAYCAIGLGRIQESFQRPKNPNSNPLYLIFNFPIFNFFRRAPFAQKPLMIDLSSGAWAHGRAIRS